MGTNMTRCPSVLFMLLPILLMAHSIWADAAFRPGKDEFVSKHLEITGGGMSAQSGSKPGMFLGLRNKEGTALWVRVQFRTPEPNRSCDIMQKLEPKGKASYFCQQEAIVADTDYPIQVTIFSDEALKNTVEETATKFHFAKADVDAMLAALAPPSLPKTFDLIVYTEKPRSPAAAFGALKKTGTLTLGETGIEYVNKKNKVAVPYSNMRSAQLEQLGNMPEHVWLVIAYVADGNTKEIAFQPHPMKGDRRDLRPIHKVATFALKEKGPIERVRFDFDGRPWSEGHRAEASHQTIQEFVLPGEAVENWTELVTVQTLPGQQVRMTGEQLMLHMKKKITKDCPDAMWNVIAESKEEIVYEWRTTNCPGFDNQHEVSKMITGAMAIHRMAYTSKKLPVSDELRTRWIALISQAKLEFVQR